MVFIVRKGSACIPVGCWKGMIRPSAVYITAFCFFLGRNGSHYSVDCEYRDNSGPRGVDGERKPIGATPIWYHGITKSARSSVFVLRNVFVGAVTVLDSSNPEESLKILVLSGELLSNYNMNLEVQIHFQ